MIPKQEFLEVISEIASSVYDLHDRFGISSLDSLSTGDDIWTLIQTRIMIQGEELGELCKAVNKTDLSNAFEESADILYVAIGTILTQGNFGIDACSNVVGKNNKKTRSNYEFSAVGKVLKK